MRPPTLIAWLVYAAFVLCALGFDSPEPLLTSTGPLPAGKIIVWIGWAGFTLYSVYCSIHENIFRTIGKLAQLHWGRQIGIDLYLGLALTLWLIYLNEGSVLILLLWLPPTLAFGNLATFLYVALHYDTLVARFLG